MPLSPTVLVAIRAEHDRLSGERDRLSAEAKKLEAEADELAALLRRHGAFEDSTTPDGGLDLAETIHRILLNASRGYRPSEMVHTLLGRSFPGADEDVFKESVGSALARLYQDRKVGKDKDGRYCSLGRAVETFEATATLMELVR